MFYHVEFVLNVVHKLLQVSDFTKIQQPVWLYQVTGQKFRASSDYESGQWLENGWIHLVTMCPQKRRYKVM